MRDLNGGDNIAKSFGTSTRDIFVSFAGVASTTPTMIHSLGVLSVTQSSPTSGIFTVTLTDAYLCVQPDIKVVGDKTLIHDITIDSFTSNASGVTAFTFTHFIGTATRATVASTASNGLAVPVTFQISAKCWSRT